MMEILMVALIFMVVLVVAIGFYFKFSLESTQEKGEDACMVSNTVLLSSVASMPEIQCSMNGKRKQCIDTTKLMVFDAGREYEEFFTSNCDQKVYFIQVYPEPEDVEEICIQGTYPNCAIFPYYDPQIEYSSSIVISTPVSLYFPMEDEYRFGRLVIEVLQ